MRLGPYDGAWYTEHNGKTFVTVYQIFFEWGQFFDCQDNIWQSIAIWVSTGQSPSLHTKQCLASIFGMPEMLEIPSQFRHHLNLDIFIDLQEWTLFLSDIHIAKEIKLPDHPSTYISKHEVLLAAWAVFSANTLVELGFNACLLYAFRRWYFASNGKHLV